MFAIVVCLLAFLFKDEEHGGRDNGKQFYGYFYFYIQLVMTNLLPNIFFTIYMLDRMLISMTLRQVQDRIFARQIYNSVMITILCYLGYTLYDSMDLLAPATGHGLTVLVFWVILAVYWYLCWWVTFAAIFLIVALVAAVYMIVKRLARLYSRRPNDYEPVRRNRVDILQ